MSSLFNFFVCYQSHFFLKRIKKFEESFNWLASAKLISAIDVKLLNFILLVFTLNFIFKVFRNYLVWNVLHFFVTSFKHFYWIRKLFFDLSENDFDKILELIWLLKVFPDDFFFICLFLPEFLFILKIRVEFKIIIIFFNLLKNQFSLLHLFQESQFILEVLKKVVSSIFICS